MEGRAQSSLNVDDHSPLHDRPTYIIHRYLEELMRLTHKHPAMMSTLVKVVGASSLALLTSPWWSSSLSGPAAVAAGVIGAAGAAASGVSWFMQNKFYGYPIDNVDSAYQPAEFKKNTGRAKIIIEDNAMPRLQIEADRPYDAGYVEGYILGEALEHNLNITSFIYTLMKLKGAPHNKYKLNQYLEDVKKHIPKRYVYEMQGKVDGYNDWMIKNNKRGDLLTLDYYLLLQLLPDIRNFDPFVKQNKAADNIADSVANDISPACTTIALRVGDYTFVTRVLDWPSYGDCGRYLLQVDRKIGDVQRTIDIGIPLLSGALTVVNEHDMMLEMNVAHGDKVEEPNGMPAVFFNRLCAEKATCVNDIEKVIEKHAPLGAYHLTATDGENVRSFHFYQHPEHRGDHAVEDLAARDEAAQCMIVANHGLVYEDDEAKVDDHRDSDKRKANIFHLFHKPQVQARFKELINEQQGQSDLPESALKEIKEFCLQIARLPLVSNRDSVLCALYIYHHRALIDASAACDNLHAQKHELGEFKRLSRM